MYDIDGDTLLYIFTCASIGCSANLLYAFTLL